MDEQFQEAEQMFRHIEIRRDRGADLYFEKNKQDAAYALVLVTYGRCLFMLDEEKVIADKGEVLIIPCGVGSYGKSIPTVIHDKYVLSFEWPHAEEPPLPMLRGGAACHFKLKQFDLTLRRLRQLERYSREGLAHGDLLTDAVITEQLVLLNREWEEREMTTRSAELAERMKAFVDTHYREKVTKSRLGPYVGVSPNYAASLFRRITGQTISEYVHALRMATAQRLLVESSLTVADIADYLGYSDPSFFYRIFKKSFGQLPAEYMKNREPAKR
jgi:AraC family transcriptional regulator of arabinose operon